MTVHKENPRIVVRTDAPYKVIGVENFYDADGNRLPTRELMHLCRCRESKNKPCCDGSHREKGIDGTKKEGRLKDKVHSFKGKQITIHDNRAVCSHDGACVELLRDVFETGRRPWINPNAAPVEEIIKVIEKCPSGALSYTLNGVHHNQLEREPAIRISHNGSYEVTGGILLDDDQGSVPLSPEHYTLCSCGVSKNQPFCDGSHNQLK